MTRLFELARDRGARRCSPAAPAASAMQIETIVSPSGIEAWLVREQTVPLVTLNYAFHGGSSQDAADKAGIANLAADLLDEGAGELDGKTFHERLEKPRHRARFRVGRDDFRGSLRTLNEHRDEAFDLLRLALDQAALRRRCDRARARPGDGSALRRETTNPEQSSPAAAGGRPRSPITLTAARATARSTPCRTSPPTICATMCAACSRATGSRSRSSATSTPRRAGKLIDRAFGALPAQGDLKPVAEGEPARARPPHRHQSRRAAGGGDLRRPGHRAQRSRFHGRLYRQPHPRRRQLHLAALPGGAREARAGLRRLRQSGLVPPRRGGDRRHRHPRRPHRRRAGDHRSARSSAWPRKARRAEELAAAKSYLKGAYALDARHLGQDRRPAHPDPARRSRHRLYRSAAAP